MTTFDERERAFEARFTHDQDLAFRAEARCNRLLGEWAAELLGLQGSEADSYVRDVIRSDLAEPGHEDVIGKVAADLAGKADAQSIRKRREELLLKARQDVLLAEDTSAG